MAIMTRRKCLSYGSKLAGSSAFAALLPTSSANQLDKSGAKMSQDELPNINTRIDRSTTHDSVLELIGNTSMLQLTNIVSAKHARILLKLESENPTGSMKDRMALAMIEAAEQDGRLAPGGRVVEYTGGSTGVSLAFICSVKGYPLDIVSSDAFSSEKLNHMRALGANLTLIKSAFGGMDEALTRNMIAAARQIQQENGGYWTDQLNNADVLGRYRDMGEEIWQQTAGRVDAFVHGVGTGGSLRGIAERLRRHNANVEIVAVEPSESAVLSGQKESAHKIEGIGAGFVVPLWKPNLVNEITRVSTEEAQRMARKLAAREGVFAGTSTGANLVAAMAKAKEIGAGGTVVTLMVDTGMKYLTTALYGAE